MKDYLCWIRSHVGSRKIILIYASAFIRDSYGRILLQRRSDFGWWGLPGGILELDESLIDCIIREVWEETGLGVKPVNLIGVYSSPDFDVTYPNNDKVQQVTLCFECRILNGKLLINNNETLDLDWFYLDNIPPTSSWYRSMIGDSIKEKRSAFFRHSSIGKRIDNMSYYQLIRKYIGHELFIVPSSDAFIRDENGNILLIQRKDTGQWTTPGGLMELGERVDYTLISEVREETGLLVEPERLIGVYSDHDYLITYPNGDKIRPVSFLFKCNVVSGRLSADGVEAMGAHFFSPDALPPLSKRQAIYIRDGLSNGEATIF